MNDSDLSPGQVTEITAYVDIEAPPPAPTALIIFGTNQRQPADIAASRYHSGLAPLIIVTGGINRHNGVVEGQMFRQLLHAAGVPIARSGSRINPRIPGRTSSCRCHSSAKPSAAACRLLW